MCYSGHFAHEFSDSMVLAVILTKTQNFVKKGPSGVSDLSLWCYSGSFAKPEFSRVWCYRAQIVRCYKVPKVRCFSQPPGIK